MKKKHSGLLRAAALLLALSLLLGLQVTAFADDGDETEEDTAEETVTTATTGSLTISTGYSALAGVDVDIYLIAEFVNTSYYGELEWTETAESYDLSDDFSSVDWSSVADTLAGYFVRDSVEATASGELDSSGSVTFDGLTLGVYLVVFNGGTESLTTGGYKYTLSPYCVTIPALDSTDEWDADTDDFDVTSNAKISRTQTSSGGGGGGGSDTEKVKVRKVWEDDDEDDRPEEITVQLLRNGKVYDEVTLSEDNDWSYTWSGLDADYTWKVVEADVPDGYEMSRTKSGTTTVITNSAEEDEEEPEEDTGEDEEPEEEDEEEPEDEDEDESEPEEEDESEPEEEEPEEPEESEEELPQTGVLWWPVPLLACAGIACLLIGMLRRRTDA